MTTLMRGGVMPVPCRECTHDHVPSRFSASSGMPRTPQARLLSQTPCTEAEWHRAAGEDLESHYARGDLRTSSCRRAMPSNHRGLQYTEAKRIHAHAVAIQRRQELTLRPPVPVPADGGRRVADRKSIVQEAVKSISVTPGACGSSAIELAFKEPQPRHQILAQRHARTSADVSCRDRQ